MKYLLDTNVISELIASQPNLKVLNYLASLQESNVYISVISIGEIKFGIENLTSSSKKNRLAEWLDNDLLERFSGRIQEIDTATLLTWGEITSRLKASGKPLPIMDSLIAASCLTYEFCLVTRNEKDFAGLGLSIVNPF